MSLYQKLPAYREWICDICGRIGRWDESWKSYGSILMEETCPEDILTTCSVKCWEDLNAKLVSGEICPPKLSRERNAIHYNVSIQRKGY